MYEQRLQRTLEKTLAMLRNLQTTRTKEEVKNGFVFSKPAPSKIFCGRCFTESAVNKVCEHCGSRNHLMTEEQFGFMHPMTVDSDGNVVFDDVIVSAISQTTALILSPGNREEENVSQPASSGGGHSADGMGGGSATDELGR